MLVRRLVAGPSRALLLRRFASAAVSEADVATGATLAPTAATVNAPTTANADAPPSRPLPASVSTDAHRTVASNASSQASGSMAAHLSVDRTPRRSTPALESLTPAKRFEELRRLIGEPPAEETPKLVWPLFRGLTTAQRQMLSPTELKALLRSVVPAHDWAWAAVHPKGDQMNVVDTSRKMVKIWETRLRTVMSLLVVTGEADLEDWIFVLHKLMIAGSPDKVEAVWREMPEEYQVFQRVGQHRLGAIIRWARLHNKVAASSLNGLRPNLRQANTAYEAFWDTYSKLPTTDSQQVELTSFSVRLLLTTAVELRRIFNRLRNETASTRLDNFIHYILAQGWGLDLNNLPMSVAAREVDGQKYYPALSSKGVQAIVAYLVNLNTNPYRLVSVFELLTTMRRPQSQSAATQSAFEEDDDPDDEDFIPSLSSVTELEENSSERNWFGMRLNKPADDAVDARPEAGSSTTSSTPTTITTYSRSRFHDYLASPPLPSTVVPADRDAPLPRRASFNFRTVIDLLNATRTAPKVFEHILDTSIRRAQEERSIWYASYLSATGQARRNLATPPRISPEWLRIALAEDARYNGVRAERHKHRIEAVIRWLEDEISVIEKEEVRRGFQLTPDSHGNNTLPYRSFVSDPRHRRQLRVKEVFVANEYLDKLYKDRGYLLQLHKRASVLVGKRLRNKSAYDKRHGWVRRAEQHDDSVA